LARIWSVTLRAPGNFLAKNIAVAKMMNEFDCNEHKSRVIALATYHQDYSLVDNQYMTKGVWRPIVTDTQNQDLEKFACSSMTFRNRFRL